MLKKVSNVLLKIVIIVIIYILQIYAFNNIEFYGVKANLPLIVIAIVSIIVTDNKKEIYICGIALGILSDLLFGNIICENLVINIFVVTILTSIKNTYKKDSKFSIIIFSVVATIVSYVIFIVFNIFAKKEIINIFVFVWMLFKQCVINIFFAYILYLLFKKLIDKNSF